MERMPHPDGDNVEVAKFFMENVSKRLVFDQSKEEILSKDVCKINSHLQPGKSYNRLYKILYLIFDYPHKHYTFKHFEI